MATPPVVYVGYNSNTCDFVANSARAEVAINQALTFAYTHSGYTTVYIHEGSYTIRNPIRMRTGLTIAGAGMYKTIIKLASSIALDTSSEFYIIPSMRNPPHGATTEMVPLIWTYGATPTYNASAHNVTFHDFQIDANRDGNSQVSHGRGYFNCIQMAYSNNVLAYNMYMHHSLGDGLRCFTGTSAKVTNITLRDSYCHDLGHDAFYTLRGDYVYAYNNRIIARVNAAVRYDDVTHGYIYNNDLSGHLSIDSGPVIEISRRYWKNISVDVYNNKVYNGWCNGIQVVAPLATTINGSSTVVNIHHNLVYQNGNQHGNVNYACGIQVSDTSPVNIENNIIAGNRGGGVVCIPVQGNAPKYSGMVIYVKNNIIYGNQLRNKDAKRNGTVGTGYGVHNYLGSSHIIDVCYNDIYGNVSGTWKDVHKTEHNIFVDPKCAKLDLSSGINNQDGHLKSKYGRWTGTKWVKDSEQSSCIDAGDPTFGYSKEPEDNGNRIDIGMYGNTTESSLSSESVKPNIPVADFVASKTSGKIPLRVSFTDLSTNSPTAWTWNFGNGHTSNVQDPLVVYETVGTYSVSLKASNSAGSDTYTKTNYITAKPKEDPADPPEAAFTFTPSAGISPLVVKFTDKSLNDPTSWLWNFGDNTTSTVQNPSHTYTVGTYSVMLTATNSSGNNSITKVNCIKVTSGTPVASFTADPVSGTLPLTVQFTDNSVNKPTSWKWNFGDKITSTKQNPEHQYTSAGTFTVVLTVTNSYGSDTLTRSKYITVISGNPYTGDMYDNRILSYKPNNVYAKTSYIDIGADTTGMFRSLLWFKLDDYKNKVFKTAKLYLYWYGTGAREKDTIVEVYRPSITWDPKNVTWNSRIESVQWSNAGSDWYDKNGTKQGSTPYDSLAFDGTLIPTEAYYELDVTQLVNEYVNNKYQNFGFLLKAKTEDSNYIKFYSLDNGSDLVIPYLKLVEEEEAVPIATILQVTGDGSGDFNCDGREDQVQINQAIKLAKDNPSKYSGVHLKGPFTYIISDTVNVTGILEGDSTAILKLVNDAKWNVNVPLIKEYAVSGTSTTIRGFTIDGNRDNNKNVVSGKNYYDLISINSCSNIYIYNMKFINGHNNGVYVNNCIGVEFYNNDVQLLGYDGFFAKNCKNVSTYNNKVNCRINNGIHIYNTDDVNIHDNEVYSEGSGCAGIYVEKYGTYKMVNVDIYSNIVHNTMFAGILAIASSSFNTNSSVIRIYNNIVYGTGIKSTNKQSGGIITSGFNVDVENNDVDGCYSCGIGIREVNGIADITGTIYINIRSNNIVYSKRDSTNNKGYGLDYDILPGHDVRQQNNCMYGNEGPNQHNVNPSTGDTANIYVDPLYADRTTHNYSLKSIAGRYDPILKKYVSDDVNSPCIDKGYAGSDFSDEQDPNGGRINVGAYGNTIYASLTGDHPIATNHAPVLDTLTNKVVEISKPLTFTVHGTDEDNDTLSYTMAPVPTGSSLGLYTGAFAWTPTADQEGTYAITFTVSDGYLTDLQTINIGVVKGEVVSLVTNEIIVNVLREANPTTVYNLLPHFSVGGRLVSGVNTKFRALIITDLTAYANKTITSASLSMVWYYPDGKERGYDTIVEAYRPVAWNSDFACWNNRISGTAWTTPGGDWYDKNETLNGTTPFGSETFTATTVPDNIYHNLDITDLIKAYSNGTYQNTGILLKASVENSNWVGFYSQRMLSNIQLKLIIQYTD